MKSNFVRTIIAWLLYAYLVLAFRTNKIIFADQERLDRIFAGNKAVIFAFWHGRLCFMPFFVQKPQDTYVLISRHGDGALIARVIDFLGLKQVRGSTNRAKTAEKGFKNRGGGEAFRECVRLLYQNKYIAVTPDGPRGPRMRVQEGVVQMAKLSGAEIFPASFSSSRYKIFNSWDRFLLPLPFGTSYVSMGNPMVISQDADDQQIEKARIELENQLNKITREVDVKAGIISIEPK